MGERGDSLLRVGERAVQMDGEKETKLVANTTR